MATIKCANTEEPML